MCQISIITSHPVVNQREQKQEVFHRDNGVIMEENALHRKADSSDPRNGTILLSDHERVARSPVHSCVREVTGRVLLCGTVMKPIVICRKASHGCNKRQGICVEKKVACTIKGELKQFVTDCECL